MAELHRVDPRERRLLGGPDVARLVPVHEARLAAQDDARPLLHSLRPSALHVLLRRAMRSTSTSFMRTWRATRCGSASRSAGPRGVALRVGRVGHPDGRRRSGGDSRGRQARAIRGGVGEACPACRAGPGLRRGGLLLLDRLRRVAIPSGRSARYVLHPRGGARAAGSRDTQGLGPARRFIARPRSSSPPHPPAAPPQRAAHPHRERARRRHLFGAASRLQGASSSTPWPPTGCPSAA